MDQAQRVARRVAFFGGSFDPPHLGHLAVARAASAALGLDSVLFAPVGAQPLKPQGSLAPFEHRLAMTRLAIAGDASFSVSLADAPQPSGAPNYTVETLLRLRARLPPGSRLFCLMGADSLHSLRRWHRAAEIPFAASLIVASRPGQPLDDLASTLPAGLSHRPAPATHPGLQAWLLRNPAGNEAPLYILPGLHVEISASQIRDQIRSLPPAQGAGLVPGETPPRHDARTALLPEPVLAYIRAHGFYR